MNKNIFKIFLYIFLVLYLAYHTVNGKYGILSYNNTNNILVDKKNILKKKQERIDMEKNKIKGLDTNSIDMDLFDEKLKENVGVVSNNEIVIFTNDINNI